MHVKDRGYTSKLVSIIFRRGVVIIRKRFEYIVIVVIIFTIFSLVFFKNNIKENKMIIIVDGWNMEYILSDRKLVIEDFESIELGSSLDEIETKLGKPDGWVGGGILLPVYVLEDNSAVELVFENDVTNENLEAMYLYKKQEEIVLKKK